MVSLSITLLAALAFATSAFAHMEMTYPFPFRSKYNPANGYQVIGTLTSRCTIRTPRPPHHSVEQDLLLTLIVASLIRLAFHLLLNQANLRLLYDRASR